MEISKLNNRGMPGYPVGWIGIRITKLRSARKFKKYQRGFTMKRVKMVSPRSVTL